MKTRVTIQDGDKRVVISWFPGTSDAAVDHLIRAKMGIGRSDEYTLVDSVDDCVTPPSAHLPCGGVFTARIIRAVNEAKGAGLISAQSNMEQDVLSILKLERVNSHLANERTWLAWLRSTASIMGLSFTFFKLKDHDGNITIVVSMMGLVVILSAICVFYFGGLRYFKVRDALEQVNPLESLKRVGLGTVMYSVGAMLVGGSAILWALRDKL